jgi:polyvinyl alcohol dehydrogenase (cytochrome)
MQKRLLTAVVFASAICAAGTTKADIFDEDSWTMFNYDVAGSRYNRAECKLSPKNVSGLHIKWNYPTAGAVNATPIVDDGVVYVGDGGGFMTALTTSGALKWSTAVHGPVTASALLTHSLVVFGDLAGYLYGLDRRTGAIVWSFRPNAHPLAGIFGSGTPIGPFVAFGVASEEEQFANQPGYHCCTFRGEALLLDPRNGHVIWETPTVTDAEGAQGSSGVSVWSTPTFDLLTGSIYITTGENYTTPTTSMEDSIIALDPLSGRVRWVNQKTSGDNWNNALPFTEPDHLDFDFGDSPQVYRLPNGRLVVGAGQKSGFYHVVDAFTGASIDQIQVEPGGTLGGLFSDTAVANGVVFANGINWPGGNPAAGIPPTAGDLIAIAGDGSHELWRYTTPGSPDLSPVTVANGVVYYASSFAGRLFALDASSGTPLAAIQYGQVTVSGVAVVDGQVYAGTGFNFGGVVAPGGVTAFGL